MSKKTTFVLDEHIMTEAKKIVDKGRFKSMNAFVETAIKDEVEMIRKEQRRDALMAAANDPLFLADIKEIESDFK
jgi:Arc/MetJ-type ribon-helix-helix transcriptional regulator